MKEFAQRLWRAWSGERPARAALGLTLAAFGLLFLDAAGTVEAVYTITISYGMLALACALGAPMLVTGWMRLPRVVIAAAAALLVFYLLAAVFAGDEVVGGIERASERRDLVYLADLALGLGVVGLVCGLSLRFGATRHLAFALAAGGVLAAAYAIYQWPAQEFGWPFDNLNNALNTSGLTSGDAGQGEALFGWERVRGTFSEPHLLAGYLAALVPLVFCVSLDRGWAPWVAALLSALLLLAMALSVSAPPWLALIVGCLAAGLLVAIGRGASGAAALAGAGAATALVIAIAALAAPTILSGVSGRSEADLERTTSFRLDAWEMAGRSWATRPIAGHGPGQSSVKLARRAEGIAPGGVPADTLVLGSAQGLWAAALVDVGLLGFGLWLALFGSCLVTAGGVLLSRGGGLLSFAAFAAASTAILIGQVSGDRLEIRTWALIGLMMALLAAVPARQQSAGDGDQSAQ